MLSPRNQESPGLLLLTGQSTSRPKLLKKIRISTNLVLTLRIVEENYPIYCLRGDLCLRHPDLLLLLNIKLKIVIRPLFNVGIILNIGIEQNRSRSGGYLENLLNAKCFQ